LSATAPPQGQSTGAWTVRGSGRIMGNDLILNENQRVFTGFSQIIVVPDKDPVLHFTIRSRLLGNDPHSPPDAFEVPVLDPLTMMPLVGSAVGLDQTDALLNLQTTGQMFFGSAVTVSDASTSGMTVSQQPQQVDIDLSGLAAGTQAKVYLDLLGFGATN